MSSKTVGALVVLAALLLGVPLVLQVVRDYEQSENTYHLVSIDGHQLPYAPRHQGQQNPEIISSKIVFFNNGVFTASMVYKNPTGGTATRDFKGSYAGTGTISSLKWEGAGETSVSMEKGTLSLNNEGVLFVYEK